MEKINCDIIQDLIPSYVDEVCSEATRHCVDEHIKNCAECRKLLAFCKNNELSVVKLELKAFDGLKRVKVQMKYQNFICCLILFPIAASGFFTFVVNTVYLSQTAYLVLFLICMLTALLVGMDYKEMKKPGRAEYISGVLSFMIDICIALVILYFVKKAVYGTGTAPFGLSPEQCGPLLKRLLLIAFTVQLALFFYHFICIVKSGRSCGWLLSLDITGMFLAQQYAFLLYGMDSVERFAVKFAKVTFLIAAIGILGILANIAVVRYLSGKSNK